MKKYCKYCGEEIKTLTDTTEKDFCGKPICTLRAMQQLQEERPTHSITVEDLGNFSLTSIPTGWQCPSCGKINSPFVNQCNCK